MGVTLVFVVVFCVAGAGAAKHKFPTYYMEQICGGTISGHESARIEISTGLLYKRNMNCKVYVTVPDGVDLFLSFKRFSLEKPFRGECPDFLNMYKGPLNAAVKINKQRMCGHRLPWTQNIEASNLILHFVSDRNADDMGFELVYAASRSCLGLTNATALQCGDEDICLDQSLICDRVQHCPDGRDESNCTIPVPIPDELIPIIAGSTVGATAGFLLLVLLVYLIYQYIQERRLLRRIDQVKLGDTYPITNLYRNTTFLGTRDQEQTRRLLTGRTGYVVNEPAGTAGRKRASVEVKSLKTGGRCQPDGEDEQQLEKQG